MTQQEAVLELSLSRRSAPRTLFLALVGVNLALVLLDGTINYAEWVSAPSIQRLFNIAREDSLANFLGSIETLVVAGVVWLIFVHARRTATPPRLVVGWGVLAATFTYIGIDDGAQIHERVGSAVASTPDFFGSYTWQIVFVPIFAAAAVLGALVVWHDVPGRSPRALLAAGVLCYIGGVALDYVEGEDDTLSNLAEDWGLGEYTVTHYSKVIEESLEWLGSTLFLVVFLAHLMRRVDRIGVSFSS
jgi:hypothetical protein